MNAGSKFIHQTNLSIEVCPVCPCFVLLTSKMAMPREKENISLEFINVLS